MIFAVSAKLDLVESEILSRGQRIGDPYGSGRPFFNQPV